MAIDYVLRMPCDVRKVFAEPKLVAMVRQKEIAEFAIRKLRDTNPGSDIKTLAENCNVETCHRRSAQWVVSYCKSALASLCVEFPDFQTCSYDGGGSEFRNPRTKGINA